MDGIWEHIKNIVAEEGWLRMIEHVIVLIVAIKLFRKAFTIESRGKRGIVSYFLKLFLRFSDKLSFVKNKKEEYLEKESIKSAE